MLSGELAVPSTRNPLYAGPNPPSRVLPQIPAALIGRRATDTREPCQIRKEAAISDGVCVADRSRSDCGGLKGEDSTRGCTTASLIRFARFRSIAIGARPRGEAPMANGRFCRGGDTKISKPPRRFSLQKTPGFSITGMDQRPTGALHTAHSRHMRWMVWACQFPFLENVGIFSPSRCSAILP